MLVSGTTTIDREGDDDAAKLLDQRNKGVIFKNCAPFTEFISNINNTQIDDARDKDLVMPMYNLIDTVIIIKKHLEVYGNFIEMIQVII